MKTRIARYVNDCAEWWGHCNDRFCFIGRQYNHEEKCNRELMLDKFNQMKKNIRAASSDQEQKKQVVAKLKNGMGAFFKECFDFTAEETEIIMGNGFTNSTRDFMRMAKEFDPSVSMEDIFQASRNLWIVNTLQYLMNEKIEVTPAVFAYSMLYPYTDNYLDNNTISATHKHEFSRRFRQRLDGKCVIPANLYEKSIFDLVKIIESQYNRDEFPLVYESLLAIQDAQTRSIQLVNKGNVNPGELFSICIEKGGTSVVADGYLVKGTLSPEQERFMFDFGVYLQYVDDIQDVKEDLDSNVSTAFTYAALNNQLENFTNKTVEFGNQVVSSLLCFHNENSSIFTGIMLKSVNFLLIEAVALNRKYFGEAYVNQLENFSPFHFDFVKERRASMSSNRISMMGKIESLVFKNETEKVFAT